MCQLSAGRPAADVDSNFTGPAGGYNRYATSEDESAGFGQRTPLHARA